MYPKAILSLESWPQIIHDICACTEGTSVNRRLSSRSFFGTEHDAHWLDGLVSNIQKNLVTFMNQTEKKSKHSLCFDGTISES